MRVQVAGKRPRVPRKEGMVDLKSRLCCITIRSRVSGLQRFFLMIFGMDLHCSSCKSLYASQN